MVASRRYYILPISVVIYVVYIYTPLDVTWSYSSSEGKTWFITLYDPEENKVTRAQKYIFETTTRTASIAAVKARKPKQRRETNSDTDEDEDSVEDDNKNEKSNIYAENVLTSQAKLRLKVLLHCNNRDFFPEYLQRRDYWVLKNYVRAEHGPLECYETVTYATHASYEFLDNVEPLVKRWLAPVSLAIHAPGTDIGPTMDSIRYLRDCLGTNLIRKYVTFHLIFPNNHIPDNIKDPIEFLESDPNCPNTPPYVNVKLKKTYKRRKNLIYPVNIARNVARDAALTHFFLSSDVELYPSSGLVEKFLNMIARNAKPLNTSRKPRVFPISLFEVADHVKAPSSKTEVQAMVKNKTAVSFHKFMCPSCHSMPNGRQWSKEEETGLMDVFHVGKRHGKSAHWEPIFIGTHQDPHYDDRLSWEGKMDKMTQNYILCLKDYDFMLLNNAILVHKPGIKHYKSDRKREPLIRQQSQLIRNVIRNEIESLYGTREECIL
ncbi:beta-1,4-glucuronyltransferase 1-like [Plodia interpunctella]|uniref:beta-1,4-glucuronyltransferase 1-like n=1 Tax=Plodia interpunctella TaxID=58824 RepID=UPI002368C667|nr:beta-1,4-glucuronyltransferase 1-like [Plodia interpunctella]